MGCGRTKSIWAPSPYHAGPHITPNVASFAFLIARRDTGNHQATYTAAGSREALVADPVFAAAFLEAKRRISRMSVRYVKETDQLQQALLEMYVHVALQTTFNDFDTH